jgi:hypothetical protein
MYLSIFIICLLIAIPCFFTGCNLAVTSFCPAKFKDFHGHIYDKAVVQSKYKCGNSKSGHYTCYQPYLYAINQNNETCENFINGLAFRYKSDAKEVLNKYKIKQPVYWYKKHHSKRCIKKENIIASWFAGIIFFGFASIAFICSCFTFTYKRHQYSRQPQPQNNIEFQTFYDY